MKIALIQYPLGHKVFSENLRFVDEEFTLSPPIILAYIAAILERAGHEVMIVDANVLKLTPEQTLSRIKDFNPDIIGFRSDSYWFHRVVEWAAFFKRETGAKIMIGGIHVTLYPEETLAYEWFDYGIKGEAINALPQMLEALRVNSDLRNIPGVIFKDAGKVIVTEASDIFADFNDYPFPARHLLPNHLYYSFTSQRKNFTIMLTATGCPYGCSFCAINRNPYRVRRPESVGDELEECYRRYNIREVDFFDATFFVDKQRSLRICEEILKRKLDIDWTCRARVDTVDDEILSAAAKAGCRKIYYGIESGSQKVLDQVSKGVTKVQIAKAIRLTRKHGIGTLGFFMVGNPCDTKETIEESIRFAKELKLDFIQVCRTIAKPNTGLHDQLMKETGKDHWREYTLDCGREARLPTPWTPLTDTETDFYVRRFYRDFYFRPSIILDRLAHLKSGNELIKYVRAAMKCFAYGNSRSSRVNVD
jgi:radical SAM superfamily enzyme YgiQ (UPF0313 family)